MVESARLLGTATGRKIRALTAPALAVRAFGAMSELSQRFRRARATASREGIEWSLGAFHVDDAATRSELGIEPHAPEDTIASTALWLARDGVITPRQAGTLAAT
jgi:hypothetical protein